jgi:hypothetical protein
MRSFLLALFAGIFVLMASLTIWASLERSVFSVGYLFDERWFVATFCDAYCGFITFYVWVAYRESSLVARAGWFIGIMCLGNIAMAAYMLLQLWRWRPGEPFFAKAR